MTLDIENKNMVDLINNNLKKSKFLIFTECLYNIECNQKNNYANEYIMSFIGKEYVSSLKKELLITTNTKRTFIPGDEWLYYKIYTGVNIADNLLITAFKEIIFILKEQKLIDSWFFIRYNDPNFHLRIRFHLIEFSSKEAIMNVFNNIIKDYIEKGIIWKIELSNYERELEKMPLLEYLNQQYSPRFTGFVSATTKDKDAIKGAVNHRSEVWVGGKIIMISDSMWNEMLNSLGEE